MGRKNKIRTTKASLVTDDFVETQIITSLMMTRYGIVSNVKGWNEKIFLDYANFDFYFRLNKIWYLTGVTNKLIFNHKSGDGVRYLFGICMLAENSIRAYYQTMDILYFVFRLYKGSKRVLLLGFVKKIMLQCTF